MSDLDDLYLELDNEREIGKIGFTNILAIGKTDAGVVPLPRT
jgi:hypothetical protein